ncbi:MAG TPA: hypothetical protein PKY70_08755 [Nakamurella multipartita]|nr:hypothetical protein [Nakamurella multipartita]
MVILIGLWFARRHLAILLRLADLALRGLTRLRTVGPQGGQARFSAEPVSLTKPRHEVPVHSIFKLWYFAPRLSLVARLARWILRGGVDDVRILAGLLLLKLWSDFNPRNSCRVDRLAREGVITFQ